MRTALIALVLAGCGGGYVDPFAQVTVRLEGAPTILGGANKLSLAASFANPDGGEPIGALLDGGYQWFANDGATEWVGIGATVNWLTQWTGAQGCAGSTALPDAGLVITVAYDGGTCAHTYE